MVELGQQLRTLRKRRGLTLQQLADLTDLSRTYISQIETGTANPSVATLKKVADVLGVPMGALFSDGLDQPPDPPAPLTAAQSDVRVVRRDGRKSLSAHPRSATKARSSPQ
jgi:transcriptional regulator with XRE-family HTH domain